MTRFAHAAAGAAAALVLLLAPARAEDIFANRPAFSAGDQPSRSSAQCHELRRMSAGLPDTEQRIDLALTGELIGVRTDGVLWYLFMCSDVRVLCVTYESNGMKAGDRVLMKGGYLRRDDNHVQLDPCLANRAD